MRLVPITSSILVLVVCSCVNKNDFQDSTRFDISPADSLNAFGSDPVFSPDGSFIVFNSDRPEGIGLYKIDLSTNSILKLTV